MNTVKRYFGTVAVLWFAAGVGFFGMRLFFPLIVLGLPFSFLGFVVLGTDEVQERYGYWVEPFYFWLLALPCALVYALPVVRSRANRRESVA